MKANVAAACWVVAACTALALPVAAEPGADLETSALARAATAREQGEPRTAIATLRAAWDELPDSEAIVLALAQAYLDDEDPMWAVRVLTEHLDYHEDACNPRFLLAWVYISSGRLELAADALEVADCASPSELGARGALLRAYLAHVEGRDDEAREHLRSARRSRRIYAEDRALLQELTLAVDPPRATPVATGRVEIGAGYTSNGLAGSPVDLAAPATAGSAVSVLDARLRVTARKPVHATPVAEARVTAQRLWAPEAQDLSSTTAVARAGVQLGRSGPGLVSALVALSADATRLAGGDAYGEGPFWFSEAQRGELELGVGEALVLFAGGGQRRFREIGRTRTEGEVSAGWAVAGSTGARLVGGTSLQLQDARNDAYDMAGGSVVAQLWVPLSDGFEVSVTAGTSVELYHLSHGYFAGAPDAERHDLRLRHAVGFWSPRRHLARGGLVLERSSRASSAEPYDYDDWRLMFRVEWQLDSLRLGRWEVGGARTRLEYGALAAAGGGGELREVRDLMRQDDAAQRGAACLK